MLAYAMNVEASLPEHGFPVRVVVPGFAGVRSPNWLRRFDVQNLPSDNPIQANDHKLYPPDVTAETADPANGYTIDTMQLNVAVCEPERGAALKAGRNCVRGYAVSSDSAIVRVNVSGNGGQSRMQTDLEHASIAPFAWMFWRVEIDLLLGEHELAVRAWDTAGQTQPALPDDTWNHEGYLWHLLADGAGERSPPQPRCLLRLLGAAPARRPARTRNRRHARLTRRRLPGRHATKSGGISRTKRRHRRTRAR